MSISNAILVGIYLFLASACFCMNDYSGEFIAVLAVRIACSFIFMLQCPETQNSYSFFYHLVYGINIIDRNILFCMT